MRFVKDGVVRALRALRALSTPQPDPVNPQGGTPPGRQFSVSPDTGGAAETTNDPRHFNDETH